MDGQVKLIVELALAGLLLLALTGCGADGVPVPPAPEQIPEGGFDRSLEDSSGIGGSGDVPYGLSI